MKIILIGMKGCGKTTIGILLAARLQIPFIDSDTEIERTHRRERGEALSFRQIFKKYGEAYFHALDMRTLKYIAEEFGGTGFIFSCSGRTPLQEENQEVLQGLGEIIFLNLEKSVLLKRILAQGIPAFFPYPDDPERSFNELVTERLSVYKKLADRTLDIGEETPEEVVHTLLTKLGDYGKSAAQVTQEIISMLTNSDRQATIDPIVRHVHVGTGYDAVVHWGGLEHLAVYLQQLNLPSRLFIITDSHLRDIYAAQVTQNLVQAGFEPLIYTVPAGEASKSQEQVTAIYDWLIDHRAERQEALVALGGGVIGDLVGYVAATYLRGVPLVQVPTSLLAQVDAAIGGKTGINHSKGKNLIGAFYHPRLVLADPSLLFTLPERSRTEGWAEVVKYGMILDAELFVLLESHASELRTFTRSSAALLCQIVARCIDLKVIVIEEDEREQGRRALLNYGHTVGHALENASGYGELLHGEAVSIGMVIAANMALESCLCSADMVARQNALLVAFGLPVEYHGAVRAQTLLSTMQLDKKVVGKRVRWIMPLRVGEVMITPMPDDVVMHALTSFFTEN